MIVYCPEILRCLSCDACTLKGRFKKSGLLNLINRLLPNAFTVVVVGLSSLPCSSGRLQTPSLLLSSGCYHKAIAMSGSTAPKTNYMFVPRTVQPVQIDKMTVKLYPAVDSTMKLPEHAHAF